MLDRARLAESLGIRDEGNEVMIEPTHHEILENEEWVFDEAHRRLHINSCSGDRKNTYHTCDF